MIYTWDGILLDPPPLVVDDLRETIGLEPCNKRRSRTHISTRFGHVVNIEDSFPEEDTTWRPDHRETPLEHSIRTKRFLTRLFDSDWHSPTPDDYVSVTSHMGTINSFLLVINHRPFTVLPGGMIPVIIRADRV
ncbi:Pmu1p [Sugiyamaella lignohabitans]|uniref:Pmu1p n=1 Tax=Sugiyamaella lignohabitans TaxID=796027 RepID=A0A167C5E1_9ASCO|nr:Pmu1p [Sugiyamaella lignohabitans]ANB11239.1 Pmu1p [Sugiyamaella lignohabitans]